MWQVVRLEARKKQKQRLLAGRATSPSTSGTNLVEEGETKGDVELGRLRKSQSLNR